MNDDRKKQGRTQTIIDMLAGRTTEAEVAERFGVPRNEVKQWKLLFLDGARRTAPEDKVKRWRPGRRGLALGGVAGAAVLGLWTASAWSQTTCTQTLPSPMTTFCPESPARANEVNGNFQHLVDWLDRKIGSEPGNNINTANVLVEQSVYADNGVIRGNTLEANAYANVGSTLTVGGDLNVEGKLLTIEEEKSGDVVSTVTTGATDSEQLGADNGRRFCFLTRVFSGPEQNAECRIEVQGSNFVLVSNAWSNDGGQARAGCTARCISWLLPEEE